MVKHLAGCKMTEEPPCFALSAPTPPPTYKTLNPVNPFFASGYIQIPNTCQSAIHLLLVTSNLCLKSDEYMDRARENFGLF